MVFEIWVFYWSSFNRVFKKFTEVIRLHYWLNGRKSKQTPGDSEGQGNLVCYNSRGHKELDTTQWLNNNKQQIILPEVIPEFQELKLLELIVY